MLKSKSYVAVPPGATIKEQITDRGMTQKELAARMCMTEKHVSKLINGEVQLTHDVANRLESVLGIPAEFWNRLESIYREKIWKVKEENAMDEDKNIAKRFPYREMVKNGWIKETRDKTAIVLLLRKFFEVARLSALENPLVNKIACRRLGQTEKADYALLAWTQQAKIEARKTDTQLLDIKRLNELLPIIRSMTLLSPSQFCPRLKLMLAECGIALVLLPHIGGSFLHGATFLDGKKIVIGLTIRGKDADKFWFSFFHEIGHVINGHIFNDKGIVEEEEKEADLFARDELISPQEFESFKTKNDFSVSSIIEFSQSVGIAGGIVVGRLQKENCIPYNLCNELKIKYDFA